jgi:lysophospholipase L1-like esterase
MAMIDNVPVLQHSFHSILERGNQMRLAKKSALFILAAFLSTGTAAVHAEDLLQAGDRMAICGDSITEQKNYSVVLEDYLVMCKPAANLTTAQFGWGGETTWGFAPRIASDVLWFKPTVASVNYGMNDGGYGPVQEGRLNDYRAKTTDIIKQFKAAGVRTIIITGPGAVDTDVFRKNPKAAEVYNKTLAAFGDAAKQVATDNGVIFADMYGNMAAAMTKFKAAHPGKSFVGPDGVHPENVGHMVMAYTILKALGCNGNIGTITVDLGANKADATDGHKVLSCDKGKVEIESSRYPFCPMNNPTESTGQRAALSLIPFNQDLNRFTLVVKAGTAKKYHVAYGAETKDFDAAQLAAGINLSNEFSKTPFDAAWVKVDSLIRAQQEFETLLTKQWLHNQTSWASQFPTAGDAFKQLASNGEASDNDFRSAVSAAVVPLKYTISVTSAD